MKLHLVQVRFTRVFDVVRMPAMRGKARHTLFGFETISSRHSGVEVPGWPELKSGDTVLAVLGDADDWQTLRGWRNLRTAELFAPGFVGAGITATVLMVTAVLAVDISQLYGLFPAGFLALIAIYHACECVDGIRVHRALRTDVH
ncbi:hypothetical protein [Undibacterium rugosum]|uniref:hypothetical protein n=1 Tax=Undibacterium rugosum TaxID=2762291 RepID=UPI001B81BAE8|nr:hypothetical protein [Undibacterium rugosum]MBR7778431.1 hypothetical protein [Undibacterium rugosum]